MIALKKEKEKKKHVTSRYAESVVIRHESFVRGFRERTNERTKERKKGNFFFFSSSFLSFFSFLRSSSIFSLVFSDPNRATRLLITKRRYKYMYIYIYIYLYARVCVYLYVYINIYARHTRTRSRVYSCKLINVINDTGDRFSNSRRNK